MKSSSTRLETLTIHWFWTFKLITTPNISSPIQHSLFSCYQSLFQCLTVTYAVLFSTQQMFENLDLSAVTFLNQPIEKERCLICPSGTFPESKNMNEQICPTKCAIFWRGKVLTTEKICDQVNRISSFFYLLHIFKKNCLCVKETLYTFLFWIESYMYEIVLCLVPSKNHLA